MTSADCAAWCVKHTFEEADPRGECRAAPITRAPGDGLTELSIELTHVHSEPSPAAFLMREGPSGESLQWLDLGTLNWLVTALREWPDELRSMLEETQRRVSQA